MLMRSTLGGGGWSGSKEELNRRKSCVKITSSVLPCCLMIFRIEINNIKVTASVNLYFLQQYWFYYVCMYVQVISCVLC